MSFLYKPASNIISVDLVVHPSVSHPKAIELDFGMVGGVLHLEVREALLGYLMRQWNVDCTHDAKLIGSEYHLWLSNVKKIGNLASMKISPGYE